MFADFYIFSYNTVAHHSTGTDDSSAHYNSILYNGVFFYPHACEEYGVAYGACNTAAVGDHGVFYNASVLNLVSGHTAVTAINLPVFVKQVDAAVLRIQNLHIGLPERRNRSYILPVAVKVVGVHPASVL